MGPEYLRSANRARSPLTYKDDSNGPAARSGARAAPHLREDGAPADVAPPAMPPGPRLNPKEPSVVTARFNGRSASPAALRYAARNPCDTGTSIASAADGAIRGSRRRRNAWPRPGGWKHYLRGTSPWGRTRAGRSRVRARREFGRSAGQSPPTQMGPGGGKYPAPHTYSQGGPALPPWECSAAPPSPRKSQPNRAPTAVRLRHRVEWRSGWPRFRGHPKGLSLTAASTMARWRYRSGKTTMRGSGAGLVTTTIVAVPVPVPAVSTEVRELQSGSPSIISI